MTRTKKQIEYEISEAGCLIYKTDKKNPVIRSGSKTYRVGRYTYEKHFGEVPDGFRVVHKCMNDLCMNPEHLKVLPTEEAIAEITEFREQVKKTGGGTYISEDFVRLAKMFIEEKGFDIFEAAFILGYKYECLYKALRSN
jgi:hypothetical protein